MSHSMFAEKMNQIAQCGKIANIPDWVIEELREEKKLYYTKIRPIISGVQHPLRIIGVWNCNPHSTGARPFKGGIRFHPDVSIDLLRTLAVDMTQKAALTDLPFGGAKFGIPFDPKDYSQNDIRKIAEKAAETLLLDGIIHPDRYVPGPDMGTNPQVMFWMYNKVAELNGLAKLPNVTAIVTGKPLENDGCPGRADATSKGLLIVLKEFVEKLQPDIVDTFSSKDSPLVVVQGFGNVGMNIAQLVENDLRFSRFKNIIAISDAKGGIYNKNGLSISEITAYYEKHKTFGGFPSADSITNEDLLCLPCDILIPAAVENQITKDNAGKIKTKILCEGANESITKDAQEILDETDIFTIPGNVANAGGVVVSFLEWTRNRGERHHAVDIDRDRRWVEEELWRIMSRTLRSVYQISKDRNIPLSKGAVVTALLKISEKLHLKHAH